MAFTSPMQHRPVAVSALLALPMMAVLYGGVGQGDVSQASALSSELGSDGAVGGVENDSLLLVNQTDTAFAFLAFHPKTARPQPAQVEVDLANPGPEYVSASDSTVLWSCDSLEQYENYTLHLYRIPTGGQGLVQAPLTRSVVLTTERLNAASDGCCRIEIGEL